MIGSLNTAVSGLDYFQNQLEVIGNDVANSNTTAYKSNRVDAVDNFNQYFSPGSTTATSVQIGSGVSTSAVKTDFNTGTITETGVATDMAINGSGYFLVKDPNTGTTYATRDGSFVPDSQGYLVNNSGYRLQGYTDSTKAAVGDLQLNTTGLDVPAGTSANSFTINPNGDITYTGTNGTPQTRGTVLLQNYSNQQALIRQGGNMYGNLAAAGPLAAPVKPGDSATGSLRAKSLEQSNVDLAGELTNLITMQRGYQANARIVTTTDDILQEVVNLKR